MLASSTVAPLLLLLSLAPHACLALLNPDGKVFSATFDPPYSDTTLKLQLDVLDWWGSFGDTAVLPKGTQIPVLVDSCVSAPSTCSTWTVPGDVTLQIGTPTSQDAHRIYIFLNDTGARVPTYGAPYERASPGCSGAAGAVCCDGQDYTLQRDAVLHSVFKMWISRPNGTYTSDGTQPQNFRSAGLKLGVSSGFYTAAVTWPNVFFQSQGTSSDPLLQAGIGLEVDLSGGSFQDTVLGLVNNYLLLAPSNDPAAPGFVVPSASYPDAGVPLDTAAWSYCRSSACGSALNACAPHMGPTPYASQRSITAATVIAAGRNALNHGVSKTCTVLGNGQHALVNPDLTQGATYAAQYVSCDYQGTALVPVISLPRAAIDRGNTAPPPPPPARASPAPSPNAMPAPVMSQSPATASPLPTPTPVPQPALLQGPAVAFVATLPAYTIDSFDASARAAYISSIQSTVLGASAQPAVRIRSVVAAAAGGAARRLLQAGVAVDTVVGFVPTDTTAPSVLLTALQAKPGSIFPAGQYGAVRISSAAELNCVTPCGVHGNPAPRSTGMSNIGCTCECDQGWSTAPNQSFDSFKYCMRANSSTAPANDGSPTAVVPYPPPAPIEYKSGSGGIGVGGYIGIVAAIIIVAAMGYFAWRTKCCGCVCCKAWACCMQLAWRGKTQDAVEGEATSAGGPAAASQPKKQRMARPETNEDAAPVGGAERDADPESASGSPHMAGKKAAKKGKRAKTHPAKSAGG